METLDSFSVVVIGAGPAGLAAAISASEGGGRVLLVEREARLGGILKQCIHDGFGLLRFGERLSGPEYAERYIAMLEKTDVSVSVSTFVTKLERTQNGGFALSLVSRAGVRRVYARSIVLATGCRERTSRQIGVHGRHSAGVLTAGAAQYYTNVLGEMPTRRCVILGSGDIGLIMARRLTLEGATVIGVYEAKPTPSGLSRNIAQCLDDFDIPLHLSKTVTRVFGGERLTAVEISDVDDRMRPIAGTETRIPCDALILSVGLIPENELAESVFVPLDAKTKGPVVDDANETLIDGIFSCGNALLVNDLADYVSESGHAAGCAAAKRMVGARGRLLTLVSDESILSLSPQRVRIGALGKPTTFYLRAAREMRKTTLFVKQGEALLYEKTFVRLRPPEMERLSFALPELAATRDAPIVFTLKEEA